MNLPKLIATSVVRGSEKGQSHGGVYTIDFNSQEVEQHIDWNDGDIDFKKYGLPPVTSFFATAPSSSC